MSVQVEKLEKNMVKLTIEVSAEKFEQAMQAAYQKEKGDFVVQGFRKGRVPRQIIERMYGPAVFYDEAVNNCIPDAYVKAVEESGVEVVAQPDISLVQVEKGKSMIFTAEVAVKPEVTLGEYKGITVTKPSTQVSDEEVTEEIDKVRRQNSRTITVEDRPAQEGDQVTIDYEGSVDGIPFEGGKGTDYDLKLGSHTFIDTFEEQLIGHSAGEDVTVNVTFPEQYQAPELAGKPAVFAVKIHAVKEEELPEADDDFAQDVSEFDTMEEYRADVARELSEKKEKEAKNAMEDAALEQIVANAQMEIPDKMLAAEQERMLEDFDSNLKQQGLSLDQYMQYTGLTKEVMTEQVKPQALKKIQVRLVLEAIAKAENLQAEEADVDAEITQMASAYKMDEEKVRAYMVGENLVQLQEDIQVKKALEFVMQNVVEQ